MVKAPTPGRVKTRLMPFLSAAQAAALASALLLDQFEHLRALRNTDLYLAFTEVKGSVKQAWVNPIGFHMGRSAEWPVRASNCGVSRLSASFGAPPL